VVLPKKLSEGLKALSQKESSTLFMTVLAAFQLLLGRHSGQTDFGIGVPSANRSHTVCEGLIGFFVNTLVMRANLSGNPTVRELLGQVRETALGAYVHHDLPFEKLVEELQPERDLSRTPLFQVAFAFEEGMTLREQAGDVRLTTMDVDAGITQFDLVTRAFEVENGLEVRVEYATDLFDEATIARMLGHYHTLLEQIVAYPDRSRMQANSSMEPAWRQVCGG
jgi:non-ribosomal peptide synthetase component F